MPKDSSIKKILVIGSGPIVIGQGCEFDYSGTQACKALREEGYEVVLVNSNPATINLTTEPCWNTPPACIPVIAMEAWTCSLSVSLALQLKACVQLLHSETQITLQATNRQMKRGLLCAKKTIFAAGETGVVHL